jgi:hypothetical protein
MEYKDSPVPHIIINDFFNDLELSQVWDELDFYTNSHKFLPPNLTGSATDDDGKVIKQNGGIFLDGVYNKESRHVSNILNHTAKIFRKDIVEQIVSKHYIFKYLKECNQDSTLVSYYEKSDYYASHVDQSVLTCVINLYKTPMAFSGGELLFDEYDYNLGIANNRMIMFPSIVNHSVTPVEMNHNSVGQGRYTISKFLGITL